MVNRYNDPGERELLQIISDLKRRVEVLERGNRIGNTAIDKGSLTVKSGQAQIGDVVNGSQGGYSVLYAKFSYGSDFAPGWIMRRADGTSVFILAGGTANDQFFQFRDRSSNIILSDDGASGQGLAAPWLNMPFYESSGTVPTSGTTSGTMTAIWTTHITATHPLIKVIALLRCTDGSTAGEFDLRNATTGALLNSINTGVPQITSSGTGYTVGVWQARHESPINSELEIELRARRTSGAGSATMRPVAGFMRQT